MKDLSEKSICHSRVSGNPEYADKPLDSRFRGNDPSKPKLSYINSDSGRVVCFIHFLNFIVWVHFYFKIKISPASEFIKAQNIFHPIFRQERNLPAGTELSSSFSGQIGFKFPRARSFGACVYDDESNRGSVIIVYIVPPCKGFRSLVVSTSLQCDNSQIRLAILVFRGRYKCGNNP